MTSERKVFYIISLTILFILTVAGLSYSFFMARISGNESESTVYGVAANLTIEFREGTNQINATDIFPGWSETKTFSVKNNNAGQGEYALYIFDIENVFMEESISFEITSTNGGANIPNMKLPLSGKKTLDAKVTILGNTTQDYTVKVKYDYLDVNQEIDKGKSFSFKVGIREAGYEMTNLIKNGDFSDGANGWSGDSDYISSNFKASTAIADDTNMSIYQEFNATLSHKIYVATNVIRDVYYNEDVNLAGWATIAVTNSNNEILTSYTIPGCDGEMDATPVLYSLIYQNTSEIQNILLGDMRNNSSGDVIGYNTLASDLLSQSNLKLLSDNKKMSDDDIIAKVSETYVIYNNVLVVDLTETFGAGNEPTKEWCDANISWFDGTTIINK